MSIASENTSSRINLTAYSSYPYQGMTTSITWATPNINSTTVYPTVTVGIRQFSEVCEGQKKPNEMHVNVFEDCEHVFNVIPQGAYIKHKCLYCDLEVLRKRD